MNIKRWKNSKEIRIHTGGKGMIKNFRKKYEPLDSRKKSILKSLANSANFEVDLNKVRDEWRRENN